MIAETGPAAGATVVTKETLAELAASWPKDQPIVTMCACPGDATAVKAACDLQHLGHTAVRPLRGGYEAWQEAVANA